MTVGRKGQKGGQKGEKEDTQQRSGQRAGKPDCPAKIRTSSHPKRCTVYTLQQAHACLRRTQHQLPPSSVQYAPIKVGLVLVMSLVIKMLVSLFGVNYGCERNLSFCPNALKGCFAAKQFLHNASKS